VVEGIHHVGEAVAARVRIAYLCYAPDLLTSDFAHGLIEQLTEQGVPCYATTAEVFESMASKEGPPGILAVVHHAATSLSDLTPQNFAWGVALVAPQDPGNVGSILRTLDAVGASGLLLLEDSVDPYHPTAIRASMGALFWHPAAMTSFHEFAGWVAQHDYTVIGTSAHAATDYREIHRYQPPLILLLGSEREGLSPEEMRVCRQVIRLPMQGRAGSLNLSVAAGIMLYDMLSKLENTPG
jgi:TrmH family RNA methyltransferase